MVTRVSDNHSEIRRGEHVQNMKQQPFYGSILRLKWLLNLNTETSPVAISSPVLSLQVKEYLPCNLVDVASIAVHTHMLWQLPASGHSHFGQNEH